MLYTQLQSQPFFISGPCVIESQELLEMVAQKLSEIRTKFQTPIIFKASFDKANRTSADSFRGPGLEKGLEMLAKIKEKYELPILTDIHEPWQAEIVGKVVDIIQIPAFLCRQTDLLLAAGKTGAIINVKKAQFLSGKDMIHVIRKLETMGNKKLLVCERGTAFGYNNLVVDYTGILDMMEFGYPVVMDATHAVQKPGGAEGKSGGNRAYAPYMAQAAAAVGVKGFFMETHPKPNEALSDGPNMIHLNDLEATIEKILKIIEVVNT